jgi:hypothetical protein
MHVHVQPDDALQTAFEVLAILVRDMHAAGRRTYAAAVKPQMMSRTNGGFNEHKIGPGFASFREFLAAAADAGVVTVTPAPIGPDVEILPPGAASLGPRHQPERGGVGPRIRSDLWKAFVDWTPDRLRAFDRVDNVAKMVTAEPAPLEPAQQSTLRRAIRMDVDRYVPINPVPFERQRQIMADFLATLEPSPPQAALETALRSQRPIRAFTSTLTIDSSLQDAFTAYRLKCIANIIEDWKSAHNLEVDIFQSRPPAQPDESTNQAAQSKDSAEVAVRRMLHAAIDRMPLDELNHLHVPVEFYLES